MASHKLCTKTFNVQTYDLFINLRCFFTFALHNPFKTCCSYFHVVFPVSRAAGCFSGEFNQLQLLTGGGELAPQVSNR